MAMPMSTEAPEATATVRLLEQRERQQRLVLHGPLDEQERDRRRAADDVAGDRAAGAPAPVATLLGDEQQRHEAEGQA